MCETNKQLQGTPYLLNNYICIIVLKSNSSIKYVTTLQDIRFKACEKYPSNATVFTTSSVIVFPIASDSSVESTPASSMMAADSPA